MGDPTVQSVSQLVCAHAKSTHHTKSPRVSIELFGDSLALTLGLALNQPKLTSHYNFKLGIVGILGCGIADGPAVMAYGMSYPTQEPCNGETPTPGTPLTEQPWPVQWQAAMAAKHPNVVVLLAGRWEVTNRVYNGQWTNILNPIFAAYVKQELEMASNLVTATGANMVILTAPCTDETPQPDGAPWPEEDPARLAVYNQLVAQVAAESPATDSVVDLDSVACPGGRYTSKLKGVTIRTSDGVHFTPAAGSVLAPFIMPKILASGRAEMTRHAKSATTKTQG